jgi:hypothetical protein
MAARYSRSVPTTESPSTAIRQSPASLLPTQGQVQIKHGAAHLEHAAQHVAGGTFLDRIRIIFGIILGIQISRLICNAAIIITTAIVATARAGVVRRCGTAAKTPGRAVATVIAGKGRGAGTRTIDMSVKASVSITAHVGGHGRVEPVGDST